MSVNLHRWIVTFPLLHVSYHFSGLFKWLSIITTLLDTKQTIQLRWNHGVFLASEYHHKVHVSAHRVASLFWLHIRSVDQHPTNISDQLYKILPTIDVNLLIPGQRTHSVASWSFRQHWSKVVEREIDQGESSHELSSKIATYNVVIPIVATKEKPHI